MITAIVLYISANIILLAVFFIGCIIIWGGIRHWPMLFRLPESDWLIFFRFLQRTFGDKGLFLYYMALGLMLITCAVIGLISIDKGGMP